MLKQEYKYVVFMHPVIFSFFFITEFPLLMKHQAAKIATFVSL